MTDCGRTKRSTHLHLPRPSHLSDFTEQKHFERARGASDTNTPWGESSRDELLQTCSTIWSSLWFDVSCYSKPSSSTALIKKRIRLKVQSAGFQRIYWKQMNITLIITCSLVHNVRTSHESDMLLAQNRQTTEVVMDGCSVGGSLQPHHYMHRSTSTASVHSHQLMIRC